MKRICKQCGKEFELSDSETDFYRRKGLQLPKRCYTCRQKNKEENLNQHIKVIQRDTSRPSALLWIFIAIIFFIVILFFIQNTKSKVSEYPAAENKVITETVPVTQPVTETFPEITDTPTEPPTETAPVETEPPTETAPAETEPPTEKPEVTYILNTYRMKFHKPNCDSVSQMNPKSRKNFYGTRDEAIAQGYSPCGNCNP